MWLDHTVLFMSWMVFYALHSLFASDKVKQKLGFSPRAHRLVYNFIALITFGAVLLIGAIIYSPLLILPGSFTFYAGLMIAAFGVFVVKRAFRNYSTMAFLGFKKEDSSGLKTSGIQSKVRHPLYSGTLLVFLGYFIHNPLLSSFITLLALVVYLPFGIFLEERKLIKQFGQEYLDYKANVPAILPKITFKGAKN